LVFSDLLRERACYLGFPILSLFYRNSFSRVDGLISIRKGFLADELAALAQTAYTGGHFSVHHLTLGRLILCIEGNLGQTG
jgi:hypothetical protein